MLRINFMIISCEIRFRWMPQNTYDDKSTLVLVMAWCRQATSHYLNQCWPRPPTPYGITKPQWIFQYHSIILTHWGRVTHMYVGKLTIIGSDNGLSPGRRQAIIWTNAGILLFGPLGSNFSEILIEIETFSFRKMHLKLSSVKWRPFCLGLNLLTLEVPFARPTVVQWEKRRWECLKRWT